MSEEQNRSEGQNSSEQQGKGTHILEGKESKKSNWLPLIVVVIAAVVLIFASGGDDPNKTSDESGGESAVETEGADENNSSVSELNFSDLDGLDKVSIAENFESWTPNAEVDPSKRISVSLKIEGAPEQVFLYVRATVEGEQLTKFDSIYFKLVNAGGHLFRPDSLLSSDDQTTELLFDLKDLPYFASVPYDETKTPEQADLTSILASKDSVLVTAFISSLRPAKFEELAILYGCPDGEACSISLK